MQLVYGLTGSEDPVPADIDVVGRGGRTAPGVTIGASRATTKNGRLAAAAAPSSHLSQEIDVDGIVLLPALEALGNLLKHQAKMTSGISEEPSSKKKARPKTAGDALAAAAQRPRAASAWELRVKAQRGWVDEGKAAAQDIKAVVCKHGKDWAAATKFWSGPEVNERWKAAYAWANTGSIRRGTELLQRLLVHEHTEVRGRAAKLLSMYFNWTEPECMAALVAHRKKQKVDALAAEHEVLRAQLDEHHEAMEELKRMAAAAARFGGASQGPPQLTGPLEAALLSESEAEQLRLRIVAVSSAHTAIVTVEAKTLTELEEKHAELEAESAVVPESDRLEVTIDGADGVAQDGGNPMAPDTVLQQLQQQQSDRAEEEDKQEGEGGEEKRVGAARPVAAVVLPWQESGTNDTQFSHISTYGPTQTSEARRHFARAGADGRMFDDSCAGRKRRCSGGFLHR